MKLSTSMKAAFIGPIFGKRLIPAVICLTQLVSSATVNAQAPFEFSDQRAFKVQYSDCVAISNGWAITGWIYREDGSTFYGFISKISPSGDTLWTVSTGNGASLALASDAAGSVMAVTGNVYSCDGGLQQNGFVQMVSNEGVELWSRTITLSYPAFISFAPNGNLAIANVDSVLIIDPAGSILVSWPYFDNGMLDMKWESDSTLLISTGQGVARYNAIGEELIYPNNGVMFSQIVPMNGGCFALGSQGLVLALDPSLQIMDTVDCGSSDWRCRLFREGTSIWRIGAGRAVHISDSLEVLSDAEINADSLFEIGTTLNVAYMNGLVATVSSPFQMDGSTGLIRTANATTGSIAQHSVDVALAIESVDSTWYFLDSDGIVHPYARVRVALTNVGQELVQSLFLIHSFGNWDCGYNGTSKLVDPLELLPGESATIEFDEIRLTPGPFMPHIFEQVICISALSPNSVWDRDMDNNRDCINASVSVGIDPVIDNILTCNIPNPFDDRLEIRFPEPITSDFEITIHDQMGRCVSRTVAPKYSTVCEIRTHEMAEGVFVIRFDSGRRSSARKLLHHVSAW